MNCWKCIVDCSIRINDLLQCFNCYGLEPETNIQILYSYFRELHRNYEIFCHKNFLVAALSTRLDTLALMNHEDQQKHLTTEIWSYTVVKPAGTYLNTKKPFKYTYTYNEILFCCDSSIFC